MSLGYLVPAKDVPDTPIFRTIYPPTDATNAINDELYKQPSKATLFDIQNNASEAEPYQYYLIYAAKAHCGAMVLCDYPFPGLVRQQEWVERALVRAFHWIKPVGTFDLDRAHFIVGSSSVFASAR